MATSQKPIKRRKNRNSNMFGVNPWYDLALPFLSWSSPPDLSTIRNNTFDGKDVLYKKKMKKQKMNEWKMKNSV